MRVNFVSCYMHDVKTLLFFNLTFMHHAFQTFTALPGPPKITGNPVEPVSPGTRVTVICESAGTSPDTRLIWYNGGRPVAVNYAVSGNYVRNVYTFTAETGPPLTLTCRLDFSPANLQLSTEVVISMQGMRFFHSNNLPAIRCTQGILLLFTPITYQLIGLYKVYCFFSLQ